MVVVLPFGGGSVGEGRGVGKGVVEGGEARFRRSRMKGPVDLSSVERAEPGGNADRIRDETNYWTHVRPLLAIRKLLNTVLS